MGNEGSNDWHGRAAAGLCALWLLTGARGGGASGPATFCPDETPVRAEGWDEVEPRYHDLLEVASILEAWTTFGQGRLEPVDLGTTRGGRPVPALQLGAPGPLPLAQRPTVFLLGGLDGRSLAGAEAVLAMTRALLTDLALLRPDLTVVVVPWASPDGLARSFAGDPHHGGNDAEIDDDGDGDLDEDGPDDVDGDGLVLEMLIDDPAGPWTPAADPRFLVAAAEGDAPRYRRVREGRDDDGDGSFNEDGPAAVRLDRNFPVGWSRKGGSAGVGPLPLSEPLARRLADLMLARRTVAVVLLQGNDGALTAPAGSGDGRLFQRLADSLEKHRGRRTELRRPLVAEGSVIDWCYRVPGALAFAVAPWGPDHTGTLAGRSRTQPLPIHLEHRPTLRVGPEISDVDHAWARWLDEQRGGMGFVPWHVVDLGPRHRVLVGGWEPRTHHNPPEDLLALALRGLDGFLLELLAELPQLELAVSELEREGQLVRFRAQVANKGALPTGLVVGPAAGASAGSFGGRTCRLVLETPVGTRLIGGPRVVDLGVLPGGGASVRFEWLVHAPAAAGVRLVVRSPWTAPLERELRP